VAEIDLFKWRHNQSEIILLWARWYLRYALSYRDLEEMMNECGLSVDHTTIYRSRAARCAGIPGYFEIRCRRAPHGDFDMNKCGVVKVLAQPNHALTFRQLRRTVRR
jgi:hypothetical protein